MPVFTENASSSRDLRVLPSFAPPLPRLTPTFEPQNDPEDKYEVLVIGVCPQPVPIMPQLLETTSDFVFKYRQAHPA